MRHIKTSLIVVDKLVFVRQLCELSPVDTFVSANLTVFGYRSKNNYIPLAIDEEHAEHKEQENVYTI
jgi:hypothetical protein